jgi:hypothetical protein
MSEHEIDRCNIWKKVRVIMKDRDEPGYDGGMSRNRKAGMKSDVRTCRLSWAVVGRKGKIRSVEGSPSRRKRKDNRTCTSSDPAYGPDQTSRQRHRIDESEAGIQLTRAMYLGEKLRKERRGRGPTEVQAKATLSAVLGSSD